MARLRRLIIGGKIFFITTNLQRGLQPFSPRERGLICKVVAEVRRRRHFRLAGFVVMPDHLHLLILPAADDTISVLAQEIKYATSRRINVGRRRTGTLWQKGFFDRFMRTGKEFQETLDYLHQNPARKGLAKEPAAWRWSSASPYASGGGILPIDSLYLPAQSEKRLR